MKLTDTLFKICCFEQRQMEVFIFTIEPQINNIIYQAHFPGHPVTPGACLIQIARELTQRCWGYEREIIGLKSVKFLNVLEPIVRGKVKFVLKRNDEKSVNVEILDDEKTYAKMILLTR